MRAGFTTFTPDLATPPPLGAADSNDAGALVAALGEYTARCMYSRHWQHRSGALKYMADQVANGSLKDYRLLTKYLSKGLKEKVANIVLECVHTLQSALDKGGKMVTHLGQALLSDLLDKLGDGNARVVVRAHLLASVRFTVACTASLPALWMATESLQRLAISSSAQLRLYESLRLCASCVMATWASWSSLKAS